MLDDKKLAVARTLHKDSTAPTGRSTGCVGGGWLGRRREKHFSPLLADLLDELV